MPETERVVLCECCLSRRAEKRLTLIGHDNERLFCNYCVSRYKKCDACNQYDGGMYVRNIWDADSQTNKRYCRQCYPVYFFDCFLCDSVFRRLNNPSFEFVVENTNICLSCQRRCVSCVNCGKYGRLAREILVYRNEHMCQYCAPSLSFDRNRKPSQEFPLQTDCNMVGRAYYGVEIECTYKQLNPLEIDELFDGWGWAYDGSLRGTKNRPFCVEFVSPILWGDKGMNRIKEFCSYLVKKKAAVNSTCGLHVHVDTHDLSWEEVRNITAAWVEIEDFIFSCMPKNRTNDNRYCKKLSVSGINETKLLRCVSELDFASLIYGQRVQSSDHLEGISRRKYHDARYYSLNLHSHYHLGTLEFRVHPGTLQFEPIKRWVEFCTKLVEKGKSSASWDKEKIMGALRPGTQRYFNKRKDRYGKEKKSANDFGWAADTVRRAIRSQGMSLNDITRNLNEALNIAQPAFELQDGVWVRTTVQEVTNNIGEPGIVTDRSQETPVEHHSVDSDSNTNRETGREPINNPNSDEPESIVDQENRTFAASVRVGDEVYPIQNTEIRLSEFQTTLELYRFQQQMIENLSHAVFDSSRSIRSAT